MVKRPFTALELLCGALSSLALFAIMTLTFFDVMGRKFLSNSIPGSLELTELLMVVVIFAALPLVSIKREHVEFDSLDPYLPSVVRRILNVVVQLIAGAVMLGVAWMMWRSAADFSSAGEVSVQLGIPKAPFIYGISVLCAATGLVHLAMVGMKRPESQDETSGVAL